MNIFRAIGYAVGTIKREYVYGREFALNLPAVAFRNVEEDAKLERVRTELRNDDSIVAAVKLHRELFNSSLKEAVDFCRAEKAKL